ncbi:drug resistance transporter, EmrB/QacA subfamily [Jatrophihabitans endophyticus]|uniref:Drug resistance transporter, EmrB/QacA subfamily n=1 Tax=Jatrophihabitans endophyticus TaxID=1206085 RepID=A0A1M5EP73_9ACTN|nr:MFS transporter [Jatrophihabitans endophyticus]SHF80832.1 drug resistance transporter, EmrB/QacA subfamily [Jatrophihabitans endophyticus]
MPRQSQRFGVVLFVLSLAAFMASLDVFIVNVAFDDIGTDFPGTTLSQLSWVLNAYAIVFAALLVPAGRIADRYGRKAGFLAGLALFTAASAACAAAPGVWWLTGFRVLQAVGAALLTPASLGLVVASAPAAHRARSVRIWAATGALAAALGPAVGGMLVEASWRWVFLVNVPVGVAAIGAAAVLVPRSRDDGATRLPDVLGAALLAVTIGVLTLGLVEGPDWGWAGGRTIAAWVVAGTGLLAFLLRSRRHPVPVVEPALVRVPAFAWANVTALLFAVPFAAALLTNILWMQQVWHYSAIRTGFAVAPGPLLVPVFAAVAHRLAARVPVGRLVSLGCLLLGVGAVLTSISVGPRPDYAGAVLPGWLVGGVGVGLALPAILSSATADLPQHRTATGSAIVTMSRQIGMALGVSLVVAVLGTPLGYAAAHDAFRRTWWTLAAVALLAALAAPAMTPRRDGRVAAAPAPAVGLPVG